VRFKAKDWLSINPKSPLPKTYTVAVLHYAWW
jgi:hypothetical protein